MILNICACKGDKGNTWKGKQKNKPFCKNKSKIFKISMKIIVFASKIIVSFKIRTVNFNMIMMLLLKHKTTNLKIYWKNKLVRRQNLMDYKMITWLVIFKNKIFKSIRIHKLQLFQSQEYKKMKFNLSINCKTMNL